MFKKLWHLFRALVVVPLVPMLKGHIIKQHGIDIKANYFKPYNYLRFPWFWMTNSIRIIKWWRDHKRCIIIQTTWHCVLQYALSPLVPAINIQKVTWRENDFYASMKKCPFNIYLFFSLFIIYLFIYSHLFNNTAT